MKWPKRLVLVRHGESEGNVVHPDEVPTMGKANHAFNLTERGRQQAKKIGEYLRAKYGTFDAYFCSTFLRSQETTSLMFPGIKPQIDSRINELWRGACYQMSRERLIQLYPEEERIKAQEGQYHHRAPGGQSGQDVELMIHSFIQSLQINHAGQNVVACTHGNWMLLFWRVVLNKHPKEYERRYRELRYKNCALSVYEEVDGVVQLAVDDFVPW